ncbi:MAG: demethylrebeccamycin-D-glucose O-methyltransferase [Rhodospirillales bacterium]|nr:demethylrebeccamycin-D-glucose O-methyltransferase [Rhodospirillales bacterium]
MDSMTLITETLHPLDRKRVLDIGCGGGQLARSLQRRGAVVSGVDPSSEAIEAARALVPQGDFHAVGGETLPFDAGAFGAAIFLNSLHHLPTGAMLPALAEAARVTGADGLVLVIEPATTGSYSAALLPIEDETAVREAAQAAIASAIEQGLFALLRREDYVREETFDGVAPFLERVAAAEESRNEAIAARRPVIEAAFHRAAARDAAGRFVLVQPLQAHLLQPRARGRD